MKQIAILFTVLAVGFAAARALAGSFPDGPGGPQIAVVNLSSLSDMVIQTDLPVFQAYADQVCAAWHCSGRLYLADHHADSSTDWVFTINNKSDVDGAIGYYTEVNGQIQAFVSVQTAREVGMSWTIVFTHELAEALVDPEAAATENTACDTEFNGISVDYVNCTFYAKENADPVQGKAYLLTVGGVTRKVSDFVYRSWFEVDSKGPYDAARALASPLSLYKNSYLSVYRDGGWQQQDTFGMRRNWDAFGSYVRP